MILYFSAISPEIAYVLAYYLRHQSFDVYSYSLYRTIAIVLAFVSVVASVMLDFFSEVLTRGYYVELMMTLRHVLVVMGVVIAYLFATKDGGDYSRIIMTTTGVLYFALSYT